MTPTCQSLRERFELLLDGELGALEQRASESHLAACGSCQTWVREDFALGEALRRHPAMLAPPGPLLRRGGSSAEAARAGGRPWSRRVAMLVAAAAVVALITLTAYQVLMPGRSAERDVAIAPEGALILNEGSWARLAAGARAEIVETDSGRVLALGAGAVEIEAARQPVEVEAASLGNLHVRGHAHVMVGEGDSGQHFGLVQLVEGEATFEDARGRLTLVPGQPLVLGPVEAMSLSSFLRQTAGDSHEGEDDIYELEADRRQLQQLVGELRARNHELELELAARRRGPGQRVELSLREYLLTLVERAEKVQGDFLENPNNWGHVTAFGRRAKGKEDEALALVSELVLTEGAPASRVTLGLGLLRMLKSPRVPGLLEPHLLSSDPAVRRRAVETLAWSEGATVQPLLQRVFESESDFGIKIRAAGGLVRLEDYGQPLDWLMATFQRVDTGSEQREHILGSVVQAPLERIAPFLKDAVTSPTLGIDIKRQMIEHIGRGRRWGPNARANAEEILKYLSQTVVDLDLRTLIDRTLESF